MRSSSPRTLAGLSGLGAGVATRAAVRGVQGAVGSYLRHVRACDPRRSPRRSMQPPRPRRGARGPAARRLPSSPTAPRREESPQTARAVEETRTFRTRAFRCSGPRRPGARATISPSVACARAASSSGSIRFALVAATSRSRARLACDGRAVAARADGLEAVDLRAFERRVDPQGRDLRSSSSSQVAVDADHEPLAGVDALLELERRVGDLLLRVAALDGLDHAAQLVDPRGSSS